MLDRFRVSVGYYPIQENIWKYLQKLYIRWLHLFSDRLEFMLNVFSFNYALNILFYLF